MKWWWQLSVITLCWAIGLIVGLQTNDGVNLLSFTHKLRGQNNWVLSVPLPLWLSSCCLTKEVKDLGLSEPLSRARIWAVDQLIHCSALCGFAFVNSCGFIAACIRHHLLSHLSPSRVYCNTLGCVLIIWVLYLIEIKTKCLVIVVSHASRLSVTLRCEQALMLL